MFFGTKNANLTTGLNSNIKNDTKNISWEFPGIFVGRFDFMQVHKSPEIHLLILQNQGEYVHKIQFYVFHWSIGIGKNDKTEKLYKTHK